MESVRASTEAGNLEVDLLDLNSAVSQERGKYEDIKETAWQGADRGG